MSQTSLVAGTPAVRAPRGARPGLTSRTGSAAPAPQFPPGSGHPRHHLRSVAGAETAASVPAPVELQLPPGTTWLPAPAHTLPSLPGRPAMVGYLVLVPADETPAAAARAIHRPATGPAPVQEHGPAADGRADGEPRPDARPEPPVNVDVERRTAELGGELLDLTYLEFELLAHLVAHPHRVHTRDQLVTTVWGYGHVGDGRTVDVHIARLRRKLGPGHRAMIRTIRRVGYTYAPPSGS